MDYRIFIHSYHSTLNEPYLPKDIKLRFQLLASNSNHLRDTWKQPKSRFGKTYLGLQNYKFCLLRLDLSPSYHEVSHFANGGLYTWERQRRGLATAWDSSFLDGISMGFNRKSVCHLWLMCIRYCRGNRFSELGIRRNKRYKYYLCLMEIKGFRIPK